MWNKSEDEQPQPQSRPGGVPKAGSGRAALGPSIAIQGNLAGKEDLWIEGRFEGEIRVPGHQVTIGREGSVQAEIRARLIVVEGKLSGNIVAEEQAVVRATGRVEGDIKAPKVALDEGCQFKGRIDMEPTEGKASEKASQDAEGKPGSPPGRGPETKDSSAASQGPGSSSPKGMREEGQAGRAASGRAESDRPGGSSDRPEGSQEAGRKQA